MKKKLLSLVLALTIVFSLFPMSAMAAENPTQQIFWGFEEVTSGDQLEVGKNYIFFTQEYDPNSVVTGLPQGSAILGYAGTDYTTADFPLHSNYKYQHENQYNTWMNSYSTAEAWDNRMSPNSASLKAMYGDDLTWEELLWKYAARYVMRNEINSLGSYHIDNPDGYVTVVQKGPGFDTCMLGSIGYQNYRGTTAWWYSCNWGGVSYVGPFYAYSYHEGEFDANDITATFKKDPEDDFVGKVSLDDINVEVNVDGVVVNVGEGFVTFTDNNISIPDGDREITLSVGGLRKTLTVGAAPVLYNVTVNGGTGDGSYAAGRMVVISADAPAEGMVFDKWVGNVEFADSRASTTSFVMPENDITVTAKYRTEGSEPTPDFYTVKFDANGFGTAPVDQKITEGKAAKPTDLTAEGYDFGGWYTDKECTEAFDFDAEVTADVTLYAKWTKACHEMTKTAAKAASYIADGNIEYYTCSVCGKIFADEKGEKELTAKDTVIPQLIEVVEDKAEVSQGAVDKALSETKKDEDVKLDLTQKDVVGEENVDAVAKVELPVAALENVAKEEKSLTLVKEDATVTFDSKAIEAVAQQAQGNTVTLVVKNIETKSLKPAQQAAFKSEKVALTISAELICDQTGEKIATKDAKGFGGGAVTVAVTLPEKLPEGVKASDLKVYFVADNGSVEHISSKLEGDKIIFDLKHFSEYVISAEAPVNPNTPNTGDNTNMALYIMILVISAGTLVLVLSYNRKAKNVIS